MRREKEFCLCFIRDVILLLLWITIFFYWSFWVFQEMHYNVNADYNWVLKWKDGRTWVVIVWDKQVKEMQDRGYSKTRILDLLAIQSMECNDFQWKCKSSSDIWHMQINQIHKEQYKKSVKLLKAKKYWELYKYQLTYANWLLDSYWKSFCSKENIIWKFWKYSEKLRVECYGRAYNGSKTRITYWKMLWDKRKMIKKYFNTNFK